MSWGSTEGYVGTEVGANSGGPIVYLFLNGLGGQDCTFYPNTYLFFECSPPPTNWTVPHRQQPMELGPLLLCHESSHRPALSMVIDGQGYYG